VNANGCAVWKVPGEPVEDIALGRADDDREEASERLLLSYPCGKRSGACKKGLGLVQAVGVGLVAPSAAGMSRLDGRTIQMGRLNGA
jgi:hypothetical protein